MFKGDDEMREFIKKYGSILLITILIGALISVFISMAVYGRIGMTGNQATMYAGFLGLVGGIAGAMAAFLIARMQMTKQLNLQYKKEKNKLKSELELNSMQKLSNHINKLRMEISKLSSYENQAIKEFDSYKNLDKETMKIRRLSLRDEERLDKHLQEVQKYFNNTTIALEYCMKSGNKVSDLIGGLYSYLFLFHDYTWVEMKRKSNFNEFIAELSEINNQLQEAYKTSDIDEVILKIKNHSIELNQLNEYVKDLMSEIQRKLIIILKEYEEEMI